MNAHPFLSEYLHIAYGCMASDGDVADSEVSCLRSIAVQMGQPVEDIDATLEGIVKAFADDKVGSVEAAKSTLKGGELNHDDASLLLDMLVQIAEADGSVHADESRYVRAVVQDLHLDRFVLDKEHPEWRSYLATGLGDAGSVRRYDFGAMPELTETAELISPQDANGKTESNGKS